MGMIALLVVLLAFVSVSLVAGVFNRNAPSPDGPAPDIGLGPTATPLISDQRQPSAILRMHADPGHPLSVTGTRFSIRRRWTLHYTYDCGGGDVGLPMSIEILRGRTVSASSLIDAVQTTPALKKTGDVPEKATGTFHVKVRLASTCSWSVVVPR